MFVKLTLWGYGLQSPLKKIDSATGSLSELGLHQDPSSLQATGQLFDRKMAYLITKSNSNIPGERCSNHIISSYCHLLTGYTKIQLIVVVFSIFLYHPFWLHHQHTYFLQVITRCKQWRSSYWNPLHCPFHFLFSGVRIHALDFLVKYFWSVLLPQGEMSCFRFI